MINDIDDGSGGDNDCVSDGFWDDNTYNVGYCPEQVN